MIFEWDEPKNTINKLKHRISFELATSVFDDPKYVEYRDLEHSKDEDRYIAIGRARGKILILFVAYTERGSVIRLISARRATKEEREVYYAG